MIVAWQIHVYAINNSTESMDNGNKETEKWDWEGAPDRASKLDTRTHARTDSASEKRIGIWEKTEGIEQPPIWPKRCPCCAVLCLPLRDYFCGFVVSSLWTFMATSRLRKIGWIMLAAHIQTVFFSLFVRSYSVCTKWWEKHTIVNKRNFLKFNWPEKRYWKARIKVILYFFFHHLMEFFSL